MRRSFRWRHPPLGLGVDLGSAGVKAVALGRDESGISLVGAGCETLARGAVQDGAVRDAEEVGAALTRLFAQLGVRRRRAGMAIGGSRVLVKRFPAPRAVIGSRERSGDEFREAVAREAARHVPFHLESLAFDYEGPFPASSDPETAGRSSVDPGAIVFGAAPRETIRNHCHALNLAGGEVRRIELEPYALFAAARLAAELEGRRAESGAVAIVDIGATRTSVHVFRSCPEGAASPRGAGDLLASVLAPGAGSPGLSAGVSPHGSPPFGQATDPLPGAPQQSAWRGPGEDGAVRLGARIAAALREALEEAGLAEGRVRLRISGGGAVLSREQSWLNAPVAGEAAVLDPLKPLGFREPGTAFAVAAGLAYQQLLDVAEPRGGRDRRP